MMRAVAFPEREKNGQDVSELTLTCPKCGQALELEEFFGSVDEGAVMPGICFGCFRKELNDYANKLVSGRNMVKSRIPMSTVARG